jgi:NMD protein affecting ribosome stability and mRNA decay
MAQKCTECGGKIQNLAKEGQKTIYKNKTFIIPSDFELPTCEQCGAVWIDEDTAEALDIVLEDLLLNS